MFFFFTTHHPSTDGKRIEIKSGSSASKTGASKTISLKLFQLKTGDYSCSLARVRPLASNSVVLVPLKRMNDKMFENCEKYSDQNHNQNVQHLKSLPQFHVNVIIIIAKLLNVFYDHDHNYAMIFDVQFNHYKSF